MFCPICDSDIMSAECYPDECAECGATFDWAGDFEGDRWHTTLDATPTPGLSEGLWCIIVAAVSLTFGVIAFILGGPHG